MALNDNVLSENLNALYGLMEKAPMSKKEYADKMAAIIDTQIKTAAVAAGITVQVAPATGTGATTAPGSLS
jgi:hypothetical protein